MNNNLEARWYCVSRVPTLLDNDLIKRQEENSTYTPRTSEYAFIMESGWHVMHNETADLEKERKERRRKKK